MDRDDNLSRWRLRRRAVRIRGRKLPTVRLGGKNRPRKGGLLLVRSIWQKMMRMRELKSRYSCILKKLKEFYRQMIQDIVDAGVSYEAFQQRILMEAACAIPVGVGLNRFPSVARQRAIIM